MNIGVKGSKEQLEELNLILSIAGLSFIEVKNTKNIDSHNFDIIFDLNFDTKPETMSDYEAINDNTFLFISAVKIQLEALKFSRPNLLIGINALPTFLKRNALEYCTMNENFDASVILKLGWQEGFKVKSRVGMFSPRVVCMIINEAFYTLEEGTANKQDIDTGMKLGTSYPFGPFEWCEKIGIVNVYETLLALRNDNGDERYKICSTLKTDYLKTITNV